MKNVDKKALLRVEQTARQQKVFSKESLQKDLPNERRYQEAIEAFWNSLMVLKNGEHGHCVPAEQSGGTNQYSEVMTLLKKGYSVYVEFTDLKNATGYPLPGNGMRAKIVSVQEIKLPEPPGLAKSTFIPVIACEFDFSGFRDYNKHLASIVTYPEKDGAINTVSLIDSVCYPQDEMLRLETFGELNGPTKALFRVVGLTCCQ